MHIFKQTVWRVLAIVAVILAVLVVTLTGIANTFAPMVNEILGIEGSQVTGGNSGEDTQYYKSDYKDLGEMFHAKTQLVREIVQEGTVLLKNEDSLPLSGGKVTVLGGDELRYSSNSGGGSIGDFEVGSTTLAAALAHHGLTVNTEESAVSGSDAVIVVVARSAGEGTDVPLGSLSLTAEETRRIDVAKAASRNVILLVSGDHPVEIGAYAADPAVKGILKVGNVGYRGAYGLADVIVGEVSPSGRLVDTFAADTMSTPAMMNFGDHSYTNGTRIRASQAKNYVSYNEGIYYDYRYYETRYEDCILGQGNASSSVGAYASTSGWNYAEEVIYPFGYGLSYTTFEQEIVGEPVFDEEARTATVSVKVTNTGDVPGKQVVQLYAQAPYTAGGIEKASVQLAGYGKTDMLASGAEEMVEITVHMQWLASYDYEDAKTYVMEPGNYYFAVGESAHDALNNILASKGEAGMVDQDGNAVAGDASLTRMWTLDEADDSYATSLYTGKQIGNQFADADINYWLDDADDIDYLSRSAWDTTYPETLEIAATSDMISSLNDVRKYENGEWNDAKSRAKNETVAYVDITAADGLSGLKDTKNVVSMRGKAYDDEGWEEILDSLSIYEISNMVANGRHNIQAAPSVTFPESSGGDGPIGLNSTPYLFYSIDPETGETVSTAGKTVTDGITDAALDAETMQANLYTSEPVLAATFNADLALRQGKMIGEDGLYCDASFLWAPGLNIHRTPYGGRTSEYYSADPVINSLMGAGVNLGAKEKGVVLENKHFVINEQEDHRIGVATFTNEQALREIYLRAFEGVATYGEMQGLMSSYNRIGLLSTSAEYDLLTVVLREEWGSQAYVITDLGSPTAGLYDGNASAVAGVSTMMNNGVYDNASGSYVNTTLSIDAMKADPVLLTAAREACHRIMFNFIHSNAVNGIASDSTVTFVTAWWQPTLLALEIVFSVIAVGCAGMYIASGIVQRKEDGKNAK